MIAILSLLAILAAIAVLAAIAAHSIAFNLRHMTDDPEDMEHFRAGDFETGCDVLARVREYEGR